MGTVFAKFGVANPLHPACETSLELLVDTGALYSVLPASVLRQLGIEPRERKSFKTADGRRIERPVGVSLFIHREERGISTVVFGEEGDRTVIGLPVLETLGLEVDAATGTLRTATLPLFWAGRGFNPAEKGVA